MHTIMEAANYLAYKYKKKYKREIEENRLYIMLYFAQMDSISNLKKELFAGTLISTNEGFINEHIHKIFPYFSSSLKDITDPSSLSILNRIFEAYKDRDLKTLIQSIKNEKTWVNSKKNNKEINSTDIIEDAEKIKERKKYLRRLGLQK